MYNKSGINKNTMDVLFSSFIYEGEVSSSDKIKDESIDRISNYSNYNLINLLSDDEKIKFSKDVDSKIYYYNNGSYTYSFRRLSDYFKDIKIVNEFHTPKRCHKDVIRSISLIKKNKKAKLVTGYVRYNDVVDVHTIMQFERAGEVYIVDWTMNLIMKKYEYDYLTNFEIINVVNVNDYNTDLKYLKQIPINLKVYSAFSQEIEKDLEKNKLLLKK